MKPPQMIQDLYADMRDRKLLPLIAVLLLGIVAVPVVLKQEAEPPATVAETAAAVPEDVPTAAVLVSDPGLRDYRERLAELSSKNPFASDSGDVAAEKAKAQVEDVVKEAAASAGLTDPASTASGTIGGGSTGVTESTTTETSTSESSEVIVEDSDDSSSSGGSGGGSRWYTFSVDVLTGPAGDTRRRNNLQTLTVLPSESNPVAVYIGVSDGGKKAVFMVSPDVVDTDGAGSCLPAPSACQFLTLKKGQEQKLDYAPSGEADTFVIDVKDIRFEEVRDPQEVTGSEDPKRTKEGLSAFAGG
jgi:hypothetical protein